MLNKYTYIGLHAIYLFNIIMYYYYYYYYYFNFIFSLVGISVGKHCLVLSLVLADKFWDPVLPNPSQLINDPTTPRYGR
jgi:hypothetical protein